MVEPNRTEAIVEFDYVAQESDELSLQKGDVITDIRTQPGGWWEGSLGTKRGMFPDNFVRVLSESDNIKDSLANDVTLRPASGRRCKVLYSYQPVNEDELPLQVNDVIDIIAEVEEGWWKGRLKDAVGVFPSNFVSEVEHPPEGNHAAATASNRKSRSSSRDDASESDGELSTSVSSPDSSQLLDKADQEADAPLLPPKPVKEVCRALFPYEAANEDELTLKEGDQITLISKEVQDKGWWRGELRGRTGVFPDNFVEIVPQDEQPKKPERPPAKSHLATTTNRTRDTITKPSVTSGSGKSDSGEVALRKPPSDMPPRPDDRMSVVPPVPGKKPSLPPPIKKPQRVGSVSGMYPPTKQHESAEQRLSDVLDGAGPSRVSRSHSLSRNTKEEVPEFDSVERNAMLIHPTAFRAKAPRRRLPTTIYNKETNSVVHDILLTDVTAVPQEPSSGLMNGNAETGPHDLDNLHEENEEKEEGGPRGRLWEKNKVPWVEELKLNQAKKSLPGPRSSLSPRSPTLLQQSPVTSTRTPEQIEKKPTPPPKEKPQTEQGHNRLVSPQTHTPSSSSEGNISAPFDMPAKQTHTGVTMRMHGSPRAQSMYTSEVGRPQTRPFSMSSSAGLSLDQPRVKPTPTSQSVNRSISPSIVTSLFSTISPLPTTPLLANIQSSKGDSHSPSSLSDYDVISPAATIPSPGPTVTNKQFMELREKVTKLEQNMAQQREMFTQALKEITDKLNEEITRRHQVERELDKLSTLMTQV